MSLEVISVASYDVAYNVTAGGTVFSWYPDATIIPYFSLTLFSNISQGEIIYGFNWTWITQLVAHESIEGDNCSMYLEFEVGATSDWCPNRTAGTTDYLEWNLCADTGGIPGFPITFALLSLLTLLGVTILLQRNRIKF